MALTLEITGKPGLLAFLVLGTAPGQVCLPPYGSLLVDPKSPWAMLSWRTVPSRSLLTIPARLRTPQRFVFQVGAFDSAMAAGNISNAVQLTIQ